MMASEANNLHCRPGVGRSSTTVQPVDLRAGVSAPACPIDVARRAESI